MSEQQKKERAHNNAEESGVSNSESKRPRVAIEGSVEESAPCSSSSSSGVVEGGPTTRTPAAAAAKTNDDDGDDGDAVEVVGTKNRVRLPHMRQHCEEKPFCNDTGYSLSARQAVNSESCDLCYCYVCDVPVKDCQGNWKDHCMATDSGPRKAYWAQRRKDAQKKVTAAAKAAAAAAAAVPHFRHDCPKDRYKKPSEEFSRVREAYARNALRCKNCICYICDEPAAKCNTWSFMRSSDDIPHCNASPDDKACRWMRQRVLGPGPFAPDHKAGVRDETLSKCKYCGWFSRSSGYCDACGRVAADVKRTKTMAYSPTPEEFLLGTKEIKFRLKPHDPRPLQKYRQRWSECEGQPGWIFDESVHMEDLFYHIFTCRPVLSEIRLAVVNDCDIYEPARPGSYKHEEKCILLEKQDDFFFLEELDLNSDVSEWAPVTGDIRASWDRKTSKGTFYFQTWIKSLPSVSNYHVPTPIARFLGAWFGVLPFKSNVTFNLEAEADGPSSWCNDHISGRPVRQHRISDEAIQAFNDEVFALRQKLEFESASGSQILGGTCPSDVSFEQTLRRFFVAIIPECVVNSVLSGFGGFFYSDYEDFYVSEAYCFDSFLGYNDYQVAICTRRHASRLLEQTQSTLKGLLHHLEDRGHAAAPQVEGLAVKLLPFQLQALQWALERETTPGGLQSFLWTQLPNTDLYYNPILGKISSSKPALVRGGIIGSQKGLGTTIISLALILQNPAPASPVSGSPVASIVNETDSSTGGPFWNPDLSQPASAAMPRRGSIISRGTLVVCTVSALGQWVDEVKSKLTDPGPIHVYHGARRKRDPDMLAKSAIVLTTYETLASDTTLHAKKSKDGEEFSAPCELICWWRVICDECHTHLRNGNSGKTKAVMNLTADIKWLISGTPITVVKDLHNLLRFLAIQDCDALMKIFQGTKIGGSKPTAFGDEPPLSVPVLGMFTFFMRSIMIRHSQEQKYTGTDTTLLSFPPSLPPE